MKRESFPRRFRLTKRSEYLRVQGQGMKLHLPHFLVFIAPSEARSSVTRLGVTVTKKVGGAVLRNRIRRRVREVFRRHRDELSAAVDMVWIAKRNASGVEYADVERGFAGLARHLARGETR